MFEGASLVIALREFAIYRRERKYPGSMFAAIRETKNPAMFLTVLEDSAALIGLGIAAGGITLRWWTGIAAFDGIASILIGMVQMAEALVLSIECRGLITGEPARPIVVDAVNRAIARHADDLPVQRVRTLQLGPESILVFLDVDLSALRTPATVHDRLARLRSALRESMPTITELVIAPAQPNAPSRGP